MLTENGVIQRVCAYLELQEFQIQSQRSTSQAKRIVCKGLDRTVIDGPFTESKELIAGFSIWEVKDMDEAVAWAKRAPNPMPGESEMEIRPFYEAEDLAAFMTPEELAAPRDGDRGKLGVA